LRFTDLLHYSAVSRVHQIYPIPAARQELLIWTKRQAQNGFW